MNQFKFMKTALLFVIIIQMIFSPVVLAANTPSSVATALLDFQNRLLAPYQPLGQTSSSLLDACSARGLEAFRQGLSPILLETLAPLEAAVQERVELMATELSALSAAPPDILDRRIETYLQHTEELSSLLQAEYEAIAPLALTPEVRGQTIAQIVKLDQALQTCEATSSTENKTNLEPTNLTLYRENSPPEQTPEAMRRQIKRNLQTILRDNTPGPQGLVRRSVPVAVGVVTYVALAALAVYVAYQIGHFIGENIASSLIDEAHKHPRNPHFAPGQIVDFLGVPMRVQTEQEFIKSGAEGTAKLSAAVSAIMSLCWFFPAFEVMEKFRSLLKSSPASIIALEQASRKPRSWRQRLRLVKHEQTLVQKYLVPEPCQQVLLPALAPIQERTVADTTLAQEEIVPVGTGVRILFDDPKVEPSSLEELEDDATGAQAPLRLRRAGQ